MRLLTLGAAVLVFASAAQASALDPASSRTAGDWRLSEVGGKVACTLTFTLQTNFAGYEVKAPLACRRAFPALQTLAGWTLDAKGGIVLADAHAQPIVTFPAQTGAPFETRAPDGHTWRLEPLKSDGTAPSGSQAAPVPKSSPTS